MVATVHSLNAPSILSIRHPRLPARSSDVPRCWHGGPKETHSPGIAFAVSWLASRGPCTRFSSGFVLARSAACRLSSPGPCLPCFVMSTTLVTHPHRIIVEVTVCSPIKMAYLASRLFTRSRTRYLPACGQHGYLACPRMPRTRRQCVRRLP